MKEQIAFRSVHVNASRVSYITPESEEIKIRLENSIMSGGTVVGPGDEEPDD